MEEADERRFEALLRAASREERTVLAEAERLEHVPEDEAIARLVHAAGARARRRRVVRWLVSAAAAGILVFVGLRFAHRDPRSTPPRTLGSEPLQLLAPLGERADYARFAWDASALDAAWFQVVVSSGPAPDASGGDVLTRSPRVVQSVWAPSEQDTATWPDRIRWEVRAFDASGALLRASSAWASR